MSKIVWTAENGWTNEGPEARVALDERGRLEITPIATGDACVDCFVLVANGETPPEMDEDETAAYLTEIDRRCEGFIVVPACEENCEGGFSWRACDVCGSPLGGDRHPVAFLPV